MNRFRKQNLYLVVGMTSITVQKGALACSRSLPFSSFTMSLFSLTSKNCISHPSIENFLLSGNWLKKYFSLKISVGVEHICAERADGDDFVV
jgi:hypothetical protein